MYECTLSFPEASLGAALLYSAMLLGRTFVDAGDDFIATPI
jgi:hypothetical protein